MLIRERGRAARLRQEGLEPVQPERQDLAPGSVGSSRCEGRLPQRARLAEPALADQRKPEEIAGAGAVGIELGRAAIGQQRGLGQRSPGVLDQRRITAASANWPRRA
jgi:hypothetical protein